MSGLLQQIINPPTHLNAAQCALLMDPVGDLGLRLRGVATADMSQYPSFTVFTANDGLSNETSLKWVYQLNEEDGYWVFKSNGATIFGLSSNPGAGQNLGQFALGQEVDFRTCDLRWLAGQLPTDNYDTQSVAIDINGVYTWGTFVNGSPQYHYCWQQATGSPLPPLTNLWIGQNPDGSGVAPFTWNLLESHRSSQWYRPTPGDAYIILLGDSTDADYRKVPSSIACARAVPGYRSAPRIVNFAYPGAFSTHMLASLQAPISARFLRDANVKAIIDGSGANDVQNSQSAPQVQASLQANINFCKANWPSAPFIRKLLKPCNQLQGGAPAQAVWQALNGTGSTSIQQLTGYDYLVTSIVAALETTPGWTQGQPSSGLNPLYQAIDAPGIKDGIHMNFLGKTIVGNADKVAAQSFGLWLG